MNVGQAFCSATYPTFIPHRAVRKILNICGSVMEHLPHIWISSRPPML